MDDVMPAGFYIFLSVMHLESYYVKVWSKLFVGVYGWVAELLQA